MLHTLHMASHTHICTHCMLAWSVSMCVCLHSPECVWSGVVVQAEMCYVVWVVVQHRMVG